MSDNNKAKLKRSLTPIQMIAIASGAVIGGWLAEAPYWFSVTGAGSALIFPILAILLIPVGLAFSELSAMLPFASAVNVWTTNALGPKIGWMTQWLMFLVQVVEPPMMAYIFITVINHYTPVEIDVSTQRWIVIGIVLLWYILSNFDISLIGKLSNIFFFGMIAISLFVALYFFFSGHWSAANLKVEGGLFPQGFHGVFIAMAVFSLKYIGFELTPTMVEETTFPARKMWRVILSALFVPALLYLIVVFAIGGMASWKELAEMSMPEPELVIKLGLPAIIGTLAIISGCLHAFSTLMGFWTSSARVLYGSAQLNQLPKAFEKVNRHGQPWLANLVVLGFSIFFCLFTGENWVQYIYAVSCIAAGLVYMMCCIDVLVLRKKHPDWPRPYKAPTNKVLFYFGILVSIWIIIGSSLELNLGGYISLIIYLVIGVFVAFLMHLYRAKKPDLQLVTLTPDDISDDMNK